MSCEYIKTEMRGHVLLFTMNRPEVYNAIKVDMHNEMAACYDAFIADPDLWVAVLTGAGDKAFTAGNDLKVTGGSKARIPETGFAGLVSPSAVKATKRVLNDLSKRDGTADSIRYFGEVIVDL
jgi:enoyl-CoA hydratase/carnithine racemase